MIKDYKYIIIIASLVFVIVLGFTFKQDTQKLNTSKKIVSVSTFVLYDIAKHIAGDTLELVRIIPSGVDVHAYEPTPLVMAKVEKSALVVYNGAGLEPWLESFNFKAKAIKIAKYIKLKHLKEEEHDEHEHHEHHEHGCSHSSFDPHFWLDVDNMKRAADIMTNEFVLLYPKNKDFYVKNKNAYISMLESLHSKYTQKLKSCKLDTIITNHNAFSYLSDKYKFHVNSLKGLSPDAQSSPKDMIRIIEEIKEHNVSVIFFEDFSSNKSMATLAKQGNVKIDSLHTLGNNTKEDVENNASYEDIMLRNLTKLHEALVCQ